MRLSLIVRALAVLFSGAWKGVSRRPKMFFVLSTWNICFTPAFRGTRLGSVL